MFSTRTKPKTTPTRRGWFSLRQSAEVFDVSAQNFHKTYRGLIPPPDIDESGGAIRVRLRGLIDAVIDKRTQDAAKAADPLLSGNNSPELERYRKARADLAEMEAAERAGDLIPRRQLEPAFNQYASAVRRTGEILQRQFGNAAAELLNEHLADAEKIIRDSFKGAGA